jgi:hypothetical protein
MKGILGGNVKVTTKKILNGNIEATTRVLSVVEISNKDTFGCGNIK